MVPIRGNVGTRIAKVSSGEIDGVVVAAAGVLRLGLSARIAELLDPDVFVPDAGQGALIVQVRPADVDAERIATFADDADTRFAVTAERAFVRAMGGGCSTPVAAHVRLESDLLKMNAMAVSPDGKSVIRESMCVELTDPVAAGETLAEAIIDAGAAAPGGEN